MARKDEVITDVELMLGLVWPPEIAEKLNYRSPHALYAALKKWGRPDLARHFLKVHYDGLCTNYQRTAQARREGAVV